MQLSLIALLATSFYALPAVNAEIATVENKTIGILPPISIFPVLPYGRIELISRSYPASKLCVYTGKSPFYPKGQAYLYDDCSKAPQQHFKWGPEFSSAKPVTSTFFIQDTSNQYMYVEMKYLSNSIGIKSAPVVPTSLSSFTAPVTNRFTFSGDKFTGFSIYNDKIGVQGCIGVDERSKTLVYGFPRPGRESVEFCKTFSWKPYLVYKK